MSAHQNSGFNNGQFLRGQPRPVGSGRKKGTPNKQTALIRSGLQSALEVLRGGNGDNPIEAAFGIAKLLQEISSKRLESLGGDIAKLAGPEFDRMRETLAAAAAIHLRLAEFAFPKLARIDLAGEAPAVLAQQKIVVKLNVPRLPRANRTATIEYDAAGPAAAYGDKSAGV
jgi:hypothetical protein